MKRICWVAIVGLLVSMCAAAQDNAAMDQAKKEALDQAQKAQTMATQTSTVIAKIMGSDKTMLTAPVTGAPYSADEITTFTQTLADGTHIRREDKVTVYRDSQGRLRRQTPTEITITDPVAAVAYTLDPNKLTARKMAVMTNYRAMYYAGPVTAPDSGPAMMAARKPAIDSLAKTTAEQAASGAKTFTITIPRGEANTFFFLKGDLDSNPSSMLQSLGAQSIEGVLSEGTSETETIPTGSIGNDRPIQVVSERWYSSDLKTVTMTKHSDPRTGEEVFRLTDIRRIEPGLDLFQVPAGYQVVGTGNISTEAGQKR